MNNFSKIFKIIPSSLPFPFCYAGGKCYLLLLDFTSLTSIQHLKRILRV